MTLIDRFWLQAVVASGLIACSSAYAQHRQAPVEVRIESPPDAAPVQRAAAPADESVTELAKKVQNPVGDVYTLPFQNNTNFGVGPHRGTQDILNVQPVIPIHLNQDWKMITRMVMPLVWSPSARPRQSVPFGFGAMSISAFLSPNSTVNGWTWGAGPIAQLPTITHKTLGSNVWGLGPALVIVKMAGSIVTGAYVSNVFALGGTSGAGATRYGLLTVNPFLHYNFGNGWFISSSPTITADEMSGGAKWTVPVGMQLGRLIKIGGKLPVNLLAGAYYNVLRPQYGAPWEFRTVAAFVF